MEWSDDELSPAKKIRLSVWKRLFGYALRRKKIVVLVSLQMIVIAGIDIIYPMLAKYAIDHFIMHRTFERLGLFTALYCALVLLQGLFVGLFIAGTGRIEMGIAHDIRKEGFRKLQELSMSYFDRTPVGYLLARMVSDVGRLSDLVAWSIVDFLWAFVFIVGCVVLLFAYHVQLALIVLLIAPPLAILSVVFQKRILHWQRKIRRMNSKITGAYNEGILGALTTKTLVREEENTKEFSALTKQMRQFSIRAAVLSALFMALVMLLGNTGAALSIYFGGTLTRSGGLTLGTLALFITVTRQLFDPIQQIARILAEIQTAEAAAERVLDLLDTEPEIQDTKEVVELYGDNFDPKRENWAKVLGDITFHNVSFVYRGGEQVLERFSLHIRAGETVALVGETGAGKSTIVNLICRFYEPTSGEVRIDGVDYRKRSELWLQENLGYVLQTPHLFSGSILDNIRYAKPDASLEEVRACARLIGAEAFILNQPDGYDTDIGEEGAKLSTGQKQLISFARAVLTNPRIFVLDEATSSIDTETEQLIQGATSRLLKGRTSIVVAHRLSTIREANRILVIEDGKIAEEGSHADLMKKKGKYHNLYQTQRMREADSAATRSESLESLC